MADNRRQRPYGAHPLYWASFRSVPPNDWAVRPVSALATTFKGKLPTRVLDTPNGKTKPYLLMDGLRGGAHVYTEETHLPSVTEEDSVLIADGSKSGFAVRGVSGVLGSTLLAFRAREETHPSTLFHLLSSLFPFLNSATTGTAIPHLDQDLLLRLPLSVPRSADEQAAIARILDAVDTALERTRAAVERARELRRALLQASFEFVGSTEPMKDTEAGRIPRSWDAIKGREAFVVVTGGCSSVGSLTLPRDGAAPDALGRAEVGEPVPGEDAFDGHRLEPDRPRVRHPLGDVVPRIFHRREHPGVRPGRRTIQRRWRPTVEILMGSLFVVEDAEAVEGPLLGRQMGLGRPRPP
jgi:hypothetical protein